LRLGIPIDHEQVAAEAAAHRLDDGDHGRRGDRRIGRIAARLQHVQARLRRQRMARRHDAVPGDRDATALIGHWPTPVESGGNLGGRLGRQRVGRCHKRQK
jgi:hypothetical protein